MRTVLLTFVLASAVVGQVSPGVSPADAQERETVAKFTSPRNSDKAWAAYLAANANLSRFVPQILELVESSDPLVQMAALDALIRLKVDPPEAMMAALLEAHPNYFDEVLILMGRDPRLHEGFLVSLFSRFLWTGQWAALNAVLAQIPGEAQTSHLWSNWYLRVRVVDTGEKEEAYGLCTDSASSGQSSEYPPVRGHTLYEPLPGEATNLFASKGPHRMRIGGVDVCEIPADRRRHTRDYLEYFAGLDDPSPQTVVRWRSAEEYLADARALLPRLRAYVSDLRQRLVDKKLLPPDAPQWPVLEVFDERRDKSIELPDFDWTF